MKCIPLCFLLILGLFTHSHAQQFSLYAQSGEQTAASDKQEMVNVSLVENQLKAYNAQDLEKFSAYFSPQVQVYRFPDLLMFDGLDAMRTAYDQFFRKHPELRCKVINRIVIGNKVIDREKLTGFRDGKESNATAIYEIKNGLIYKIYLIYE